MEASLPCAGALTEPLLSERSGSSPRLSTPALGLDMTSLQSLLCFFNQKKKNPAAFFLYNAQSGFFFTIPSKEWFRSEMFRIVFGAEISACSFISPQGLSFAFVLYEKKAPFCLLVSGFLQRLLQQREHQAWQSAVNYGL